MDRRNNLKLLSLFKSTSLILCVMIICVGVLVLCGWIFDITLLKSITPRFIAMKSTSAILFILIGISLLFQQKYLYKKHFFYTVIGKLIGIFITLFGLITSIELLTGYHLEHSIIFEIIPFSSELFSLKPAPVSIICFFLIGLSLVLLNIKNTLYLNQILSAVIGLTGLLILNGYFFNFHSQSTLKFTDASIYTALCFIMISLSIFFMRPSLGIMSLFISNTHGGTVARRLIPIVIIVPILLGYLRILGEYKHFYSEDTGIELYSLCITIIFMIVTISISVILMKSDLKRLKIEDELSVSEDRFHKAMDTAPIGMAIVSLDSKFVEVNKALCQLVGYTKEEMLDLTFQQITHPDDIALDVSNSQKLIDGTIHLNQIEKRYIRKNGEIIWVQLTASILRDANGHPLYFITQVEDITERKLTEERIRHLAYHDSLTNLPNRRLLLDRLTIAFDFAKRHQLILALMFLDLDKFKIVNDSLGHDVGDELLKATATRLNTALRSVDTIARISGDEFVILLNGLQSSDEAGRIATKIIESMGQHFLIHGHEIHISCTIGISIYPNDGVEISDLMKKADLAMYAAKEAGRNQYQYFHL